MLHLPRLTLALLLLLALSTLTASTQIARGRAIVGGSAGFFLSNPEGSDASWQVSVSPSALYLVSDRFAVGGRVSAALMRDGFFDRDNRTFGRFAFAPAARYYFTVEEGGGLFAEASAGVSATTREDTDADFELGLGVGYTIFLNEGLALEPGIDFGYSPGSPGFTTLAIAVGFQGFIDGFRRGSKDVPYED